MRRLPFRHRCEAVLHSIDKRVPLHIALHNLPEGLAIGVEFRGPDAVAALALTPAFARMAP